jgi:hypothetical protein
MHKPLSGGLLLLAALLATCLSQASSQGLPVEYGLLPLGDLTTNDQGGPYLIPAVQAAEVEGELGPAGSRLCRLCRRVLQPAHVVVRVLSAPPPPPPPPAAAAIDW